MCKRATERALTLRERTTEHLHYQGREKGGPRQVGRTVAWYNAAASHAKWGAPFAGSRPTTATTTVVTSGDPLFRKLPCLTCFDLSFFVMLKFALCLEQTLRSSKTLRTPPDSASLQQTKCFLCFTKMYTQTSNRPLSVHARLSSGIGRSRALQTPRSSCASLAYDGS